MRLAGLNVVLGVSGSIAAYKAVILLRLLQQEGATVRVVMTPAAARFVAPLTFSTLAREEVFMDLWAEGNPESWSRHVQWAQWADALVVAPCTAQTLAQMAHGLCDNALLAVLLASAAPVWVAPAMDGDMYTHPATQANVRLLHDRGYHIISPAHGYLASGLEAQGRLAEPADVLEALVQHFSPTKLLQGRQVLISAGPTQEAIDPVRYLSNHSTGKMGIALAQACLMQGARVTLVLGPTALQPPQHPALTCISVTSAAQMYDAMLQQQPRAHLILKSAAVADYRPVAPATQKLKKKNMGAQPTLTLEPTPDILAELGRRKPAHQLLVGFALETENELAHAQEKLRKKNLDAICLNSLADPGAGFKADTNRVALIWPDGTQHQLETAPKQVIAQQLIELLAPHIPQ